MKRVLLFVAALLAVVAASPAFAKTSHPECDPNYVGKIPPGHVKHGDKFCESDVTLPDTTITYMELDRDAETASVWFESTEPGSTFQCRTREDPFEGGWWTDDEAEVGWYSCTSPHTYSYGSLWLQAIQVRAVDSAGNADPTPAAFSFAPHQ
jgi:hypothetical protein